MAANDLLSLSAVMNNKAALILQVAVLAKKYIAEEVQSSIVKGTPVDTGLARSNWVVSLDAEFDDVIPPYIAGASLGVDEQGNANAAIAQGRAVLDSVRAGQVVYVQNNVPYIGLLNDGSSRQSPALFVELGIQIGIKSGLARLQELVKGL